jgi:hypothetical protein
MMMASVVPGARSSDRRPTPGSGQLPAAQPGEFDGMILQSLLVGECTVMDSVIILGLMEAADVDDDEPPAEVVERLCVLGLIERKDGRWRLWINSDPAMSSS